MASLNTLRTKFGVVLSIVIAFALLAFILSLKTEMGFSGNDPKVGEINGDKIAYSEYYDEYELTKNQNGGSTAAADEAGEERLSMAAWQSLVAKHALIPGFEKLGVSVSETERMSMLAGEYPSGVYFRAFADPSTGQYDASAIAEFLSQVDDNYQMQQTWAYINDQAVLEREIAKFMGLVKGGVYVNKLEVAEGVEHANNTYTGKIAGRKYSSVPDSLFTVSKSEMKKYYDSHKGMFKQQPSRSISYVLFEVDPTPEDMSAIETEVKAVAAEFAAADDVKAFVRQNRRGSIDERYLTKDQLSTAESAALMSGKMYGPELENDVWTVARVVDSKMVPDSLGLRHIVLQYNNDKLADSLLTVLKNGADFATVAREHSLVETASNGGEIGVLPFSALPADFVEALSDARKGDIVKIVSGNAIQIVNVYRADKRSKHVKVARIEYPVEASSNTNNAIHASASSFSVKAAGGVDKFNAAAAESSMTPRVATVPNGERTVRGLEKSQEVVRWAYGAKVGDISEIIKVGKDYLVAVLTEIDNDEYKSLDKVAQQVKTAVMHDKKFDYIVSEMKGETVDQVAESFGSTVSEFKDLSYASFYINGVGVEPRLVGAIAATSETGKLSAPVKGTSGVYVFTVDSIADSEKQTAEAEKVRLQTTAESMAQQASLFAVQELADIKDLRSKYF